MINNSGRLGKRSSDGLGVLTQADKFNQSVYPIPKVDSFAVTDGSYVPFNDTAADPAGGQTIVLYGSGFRSGATVMVGTTVIAVVTVLGNDRITFTSPALASGSYTVYVTNSNGGTGILVPGLVYSGMPVWSNAAGTLGSYYETTAITNTLVATGDAPMTYSITSGSLPSGATLFGNGVITGTAPADSASTTYSFTVQATDAQLQDSIRSFSLTINTDVVSWSNPSANTAYSLEQNTVMSNISLAATSAAGYGVTYAANALPTGVSLSNGVIYGTPTVVASNVSLLTATAATTTRSAVRVITWTINIAGDQYWKYTSLLLNANAAVTTSSFVNDASLNNAVITVAGDTRAQNFNPYQPGYYSTYFNGSTSYNLSNQLALGSGNFTIEFWFYALDLTDRNIYEGRPSATEGAYPTIYITSSAIRYFVSSADRIVSSTISANTWYHLAVVRSAGITKMYLNGTQTGSSYTDSTTYLSGASRPIIGTYNGSAGFYYGYLSNLRVANIAFYTNTFTPSTTPLLPVAGTLFLSSQSNRIVDTSPSNFPITLSATAPTTSLATPFTTVLQAGTQYYSGYFNSSNYIYAASNAAFAPGTGDFTVEAWVYPTAAYTTYNYILGVAVTGGLVFYVTSGTLVVRAYNVADQLSSATIPSLNAWTHVAASRSGTTLRIFVNGTQTATTTNSYSFAQGAAYVGNDSTNVAPWYGYISNFRFVKGQALYTSAFIPSTSPLTTTSQGATAANVSLLTCQSSTFIDNSTNAFAITVAGNAQPLAQSPFTPVYYSGYFNGSSDYLTAPSNAVYAFGTGDFTLEAWVYPTSYNTTASWGGQIAGPHNGGVTADWWWKVSNTGYLNFQIGNSGVGAVTSSSTVPLNSWSHVVTARYNGTVTMYLNGVSFGSGSYTTSVANTLALGIGAATNGNSGTHFPGYISNLRIVKGQALYTANFTPSTSTLTTTSQGATAANVAILTCQSLYFIDTSTNVFAITTTGSPKIAGVAPFTQPTGYSASAVTTYGSGYFDGSGDFLTVGSVPALGTVDFTIESWIYPTSFTGQGSIIFDFRPTSTNGAYPQVSAAQTTGYLAYYVNTTVVISTSSAPTLNTWNHVALVRSSASTKIYLNGTQVGSAWADTTNYLSATNRPLIACNGFGAGDYFTGYISDFRIVKGTALYTTTFQPNFTAPLSAVTNTQLLTLQTRGAHNNSAFSDNSGFNNLITRTGNTTNGTFAPYGNNWSYYNSSASNPIVSFPTASFTYYGGKTTIEAWVYPTVLTGGTNDVYGVISNQDASGAVTQVMFGLYSPGGSTFTLTIYYTAGNSNVFSTITGNKNVWNHVCVQIDCTTPGASNQVIFSINGVTEAKTIDLSNVTANGYTSTALSIGGNGYYHGYFQGYMSNLRMVKTSAYVYGTSNFTPPTSSLTAITGTVLLTCQSPRFIDNSALNGTPTVGGGSPSVQKFSPFSTVTVPTYYSTYFDGNGDYLLTPTNSAFNLSSTVSWTLEYWVYLTTLATFQQLAFFSAGSSNSWTAAHNIDFGVNTSGNMYIEYANGTGSPPLISGSTVLSTNTWYHLAYVYNGSAKNITTYVNGVRDLNASSMSTYAPSTATPRVTIGRIDPIVSTPTYFVSGYVSNFRITNGQTLYTTAFTPATSPLTTTSQGATAANVSLLTCQNNTFVDNSTNYFAITGNGDAKPLSVSPFTPTASSATEYTPAQFGGSMYFDGTGDWLTMSYNPALTLLAGDYTIECWVYFVAINTYNYLVMQDDGGNGSQNFQLRVNTSLQPEYIFWNTSARASAVTITSSTTVKTGQWSHLAVTYTLSNTTTRLFLNGVQVGSSTTATWNGSTYSGQTVIGNWTNGSVNQNNTYGVLNAYITDVRLIKGTALYTANFLPSTAPATPTATIGATNYASALLVNGTAGGVVDASRTVDFETVGDAKAVQNSPYSGTYYSNLFDGGTSYFTATTAVALPIGTETFTVEMWLNKSNAWNTANQVLLISSTASSFQLWVDSATSLIKVSYNGGTTPVSYSTSSLSIGVWYHLAVVRSGSSFTMYVNGTSVATGTDSGSFATPSSIIIANYTSGTTNGWNGYISNLRIVRGTAVYTGNFTPSTTPLTAVSGTSLLTCQSNKFVDNSSNAVTLTVNGTPKVQTQNPFAVNTGTAYYFDGTGDYLTTLSVTTLNLGTASFTIEFWYNPSAIGTNTSILANGNTSWTTGSVVISGGVAGGNYMRLGAFDYGGTYFVVTESTAVPLNQWTHYAFVRSGNNFTIYRNGVSTGTGTWTGSLNFNLNGRTYIGYNAWDTTTSYVTGYIADLRITNGYARYTAGFTPQASPISNK